MAINFPDSPTNGQTYAVGSFTWQYDGQKWVAANNTALDGLSDVTAPTPTSGDFLKWNGTAWVNDPINLGTDTTGNYMSGISVQNGLSVAHTPGEGSSATIGVDNALLSNFLLEGASGNSYGLIGTSAYLDVKNTNGYNKEIELDITAVKTQLNTDGYLTESSTSTLTNKTLTSPKINENVAVTATATELNYVDGVTSAIQTQLNDKAPLASPTFTGTVTLPDNTVALGAKTTGDYVSSLVAGTGVTLSNNSGETATPTIAIGQAVSTSSSVTFANVTSTGNVAISGRIDKTTVRESVADVSVSASAVTANYATGDIFYLGTAPSSNFTLNLTNAPTDNGKAITVVLFVTQGATGYYPSAVKVAGGIACKNKVVVPFK
jgi:hypothetical protein